MKNKRTDGSEYIWIVQLAAVIACIIGIAFLIKYFFNLNLTDYTAPPTTIIVVVENATTEPQTEREPAKVCVEDYTETTKANKQLTVTATAYCACEKCCGKSNGITASGTKATAGRTIAVDPKVIPYGTEVIIDGHTYIAEDTGGAIKGNKIDIFFDNHADAEKFGRQTKTIEIVRA